jgi:pimeloyl-ACP methyl ester carboxylesterase
MLIIHRTADSNVPFSQAQELVRANPSARLIPIVGANHFVVLGDEQTTRAIQRFLEGLLSGTDEER